MVAAMVYDRDARAGVAWLAPIWAVVFTACGPTVKPPPPPDKPGPLTQGQRQLRGASNARQIVVGEMCPQGAGGRPAVAPLIMRGVNWVDAPAEVAAAVERGSVPRFYVFGVDGKIAGSFDTLGLAEVGISQPVATGTYVGSSPCTYPTSAKPGAAREEDPSCGPITHGCGFAAGEITHADDPPEKPSFTIGGACMSGTELAVDIDGDGKIESFPIAGVLDPVRGPAPEWTASPTATASCKPTFHVYDLRLAPEPRPGKSADKGLVIVDVLGVVDLDGDGRRELVLAMRFPTTRSIVVYTATETAQRLELAGEAASIMR
jgi:hypothetical protein